MDESQWSQANFTRTNSSPLIASPPRPTRCTSDGKHNFHRSASELSAHTGYAGASFYAENMFGGGKKGEGRGEREGGADQSGSTGRRWSSGEEGENHVRMRWWCGGFLLLVFVGDGGGGGRVFFMPFSA